MNIKASITNIVTVMTPIHALMTFKQLRTLKQRVESQGA